MALHTDKTANLLDGIFHLSCHGIFLMLIFMSMVACCPTPVYAVNKTSTTRGVTTCEYILCDIDGYELWSETASCLARSVIVEDDAGSEEVAGDLVRGCAFNQAGSFEFDSSARGTLQHGGPTLWALFWVVLVVAAFS